MFTLSSLYGERQLAALDDRTRIVCEIPKLPLLPGNYRLNYDLSLDGECVDAQVSARNVEVVPGEFYGTSRAAGSIEHSDLRGLQVADGLSAEGLVFVLERSWARVCRSGPAWLDGKEANQDMVGSMRYRRWRDIEPEFLNSHCIRNGPL